MNETKLTLLCLSVGADLPVDFASESTSDAIKICVEFDATSTREPVVTINVTAKKDFDLARFKLGESYDIVIAPTARE